MSNTKSCHLLTIVFVAKECPGKLKGINAFRNDVSHAKGVSLLVNYDAWEMRDSDHLSVIKLPERGDRILIMQFQ